VRTAARLVKEAIAEVLISGVAHGAVADELVEALVEVGDEVGAALVARAGLDSAGERLAVRRGDAPLEVAAVEEEKVVVSAEGAAEEAGDAAGDRGAGSSGTTHQHCNREGESFLESNHPESRPH
jgi:hypothetical protein